MSRAPNTQYWIYCIAFLILGTCAAPLWAGPRGADFDTDEQAAWTSGERALRPKRPRTLFGRPAKDDPAQQWQHAQKLREAGRLRRAQRQFLALVHEWHDSPEAPKAQKALANLLAQRGKHSRAFDEYRYLSHYFPGHVSERTLLDTQFRIATEIMHSRTMTFLLLPGFQNPARALPYFKTIVASAPYAERVPEAWVRIGMIHESNQDYAAAAEAYETLIIRYPGSDYVAEAMTRRAECLYAEAVRYPRDERGLVMAYGAVADWIERHGGSDPEAEAEMRQRLGELEQILVDKHYQRAAFYDTLARRPRSAIIAYSGFLETFPASAHSKTVSERIRELEAKVNASSQGEP